MQSGTTTTHHHDDVELVADRALLEEHRVGVEQLDAEEAADVVIVLCSLLRELYGISLMTEVSDKLAILKERSKNN